MEKNTNKIFEQIKIEDGKQILDIDFCVDKYELLSQMFYKETISTDSNISFSNVKAEKKRFFEDTTVCFNCGNMGHVSRECTEDRNRNCMFCDLYHRNKPCQFLFCDNCHHLGHSYKFCRQKRYDYPLCKCAPTQNHYIDECTNMWRTYKIRNADNYKKDIIKSCPLCFSKSHFIDDCELQTRKYTIFNSDYERYIGKKAKKLKNLD